MKLLKNKKAQFDEINPIGIIGGLLGGVLAIVTMSQVDVGIIFKIGSFVATAVVCYIMTSKILGD